MTDYSTAAKKCIPCESLNTSTLLSKSDIEQEVQSSIPLWSIVTTTDDNGKSVETHKIIKKFTAKNFKAAISYFNQITTIAERENHHPNLHLTSYREVEVELYTHSVGGVTRNDILLAQMIEKEIQVEYSPKWLKEHPEAKDTAAL
jgi:pterin-4a-carbinolamine dehydratase